MSPWFVLEATGSPARAGLTTTAKALAIVVAGLLCAVVLDRLGHKRTSTVGDLASASIVALVPLLYHLAGCRTEQSEMPASRRDLWL